MGLPIKGTEILFSKMGRNGSKEKIRQDKMLSNAPRSFV